MTKNVSLKSIKLSSLRITPRLHIHNLISRCKNTNLFLFGRIFFIGQSSRRFSQRWRAASRPLCSWRCSSSLEGSSVIYCATLMPDLSSCSNSICSSPPSVQSNRPRGCSSPASISWASSQRRYNYIWPLYCALNLPSFKSMAIKRCNLRW